MTAPVPEPGLRTELLHRVQADQDARFAYLDAADRGGNVDWAPAQAVDDDNLTFLITVIDRHGWPGSDLVAEDDTHAAWLLVQHAPPAHQDNWLPLMDQAVKNGNASARDLVYLQDWVNMHHNRRQTHGHARWGHPALAGHRPRQPQRPPSRSRPPTPRRGHDRRGVDTRRAACARPRTRAVTHQHGAPVDMACA